MAIKNLTTVLLFVLASAFSAAALAAPPEVYRAASDLTTLQDHDGWFPHLHTKRQDPLARWQTLAVTRVDNVSPGDVWDIAAEANLRYHQAPTLSFSMRVVACALPGSEIALSGEGIPFVICQPALPGAVVWAPKRSKYFQFSQSAHWVVPEGASKSLHVELQVRLLSIPRDGKQGHKVFMAPGGQWLSIAVQK